MGRIKKVRNPNARKYKTYTEEDMRRAVAAVNSGEGSCKRIALRFGINRTTLLNHIKGYKCKEVGRPTVLTKQEEELLVHSLVKLGEWGYGFDRLQLRQCVQDYLRRIDRPNPFQNCLPGNDWCVMFENRWKNEISRRVAQNLPKNRALAGSKEVMEDFHDKLKLIMEKNNLQNKPQNIFNCDETGFQTEAGPQKVLCKRGSRNPSKLVANVTKATYTVLMCCNAIGEFLPMYINYKGLHLYTTWCNNGPVNARYNCSPSGWMEGPQFLDWFQNSFVPETSKLEGKKLLILDGHNSHLSLDLIDIAVSNNIELLCLPAHTSHLVQPLDVGVYKPVKLAWRSVLRNYYQETNYKNVDKITFPSLMKKLEETGCLSRTNAIGGFEGAGIYPLSKAQMMRKAEMASIVNNQSDNQDSGKTSLPSTSTASPSHFSENSSRCIASNDNKENEIPTTPKKSLELALLSVLQSGGSSDSLNRKRSRLTRKFAESLTDSDVRERMLDKMKSKQNIKEKSKKKKKSVKHPVREDSSSDSNISVVFVDSEDDIDEIQYEEDDLIEQNNKFQEDDTQQKGEISVGSWILAKYVTKKDCVHYIGKVSKINDGDKVEVEFLRKRGLYFVYPDVPDSSEIPLMDVVQVLEPPVVQRGKHYFKLNLSKPVILY